MSRVNVDFTALSDARILATAKALGVHVGVVGWQMIKVWAWCTEVQSYNVTRTLLESILDYPGMFDQLVIFGLFRELPIDPIGSTHVDPIGLTHYYVAGTSGRIEWLGDKRQNSKLGSIARTQQALQSRALRDFKQLPIDPIGLTPPAPAPAPAPDSYTTQSYITCEAVPQDNTAPDIDLHGGPSGGSPPPTPRPAAPDPPQLVLISPKPRKKESTKVQVETSLWIEWFNRRNGRGFTETAPILRLVGKIIKAGHSQKEMRIVTLLLVEKWENDPKMHDYIRPSTLLTLEKFDERLEEARRKYPDVAIQIDQERGR